VAREISFGAVGGLAVEIMVESEVAGKLGYVVVLFW
jgi:hypothetical protein